jgi:L-alanine-DL-glutamate epimerase-like enolase superfamily enzyme
MSSTRAARARAYGIDLVPHQTQPAIGHTATALRGLADARPIPGRVQRAPRVQDVVFRTPVRPVSGKFVLTDAPGLGLELDEAELAKRAVPWTSSARR